MNNLENEFELKDLLELINKHKLFIIFISFIFLFSINIYLYFQPSIYSSYSIIEVETSLNKEKKVTDDLLKNAFHPNNIDINKEIEILKTYKINKEIIDLMNFRIQFFIEKKYKKNEIYGNKIPIKITKLKINDKNIIGKYVKIDLKKDGYLLEMESSRLIDKVLEKKKFIIDNKLIAYNKLIKTKYFNLSIEKLKNINKTVYFKINGDGRDIYETIINNSLTIEQLNKDTSLIKISYKGTVPERITDYINNLVNIFIKEEKEDRDKKGSQLLQFIGKQLETVKSKLDNSENRLKNYKVKNNMINLSAQSNVLIKKISDIEVQILENKITNILIKNILNRLKYKKNFNSIISILTKLDNKGIVLNLNTLTQLEIKEMNLKSEYTNEYPQLIKIRNQIEIVKDNLVQNIKNLELSIRYRIEDLRKQKDIYKQKLLTFPKKEIVQINLQSKYDINSQLYIYLLKKKEENKMINVALSTISDYKVIEKAYIPKFAISQKRSMLMLSFTFLGFIIAIIFILIFHKLGRSIKGIKDINIIKNRLFYIEIPYLKNSKNREIKVFKNTKSLFTESYRKLRADLEFILEDNKSAIILVTSTIPKEGKDMVVVNLGAIFQLTGFKKSIVIDLDFREHILNSYFDMDYQIGISSYLNGTVNINDIVLQTSRPNLDIIPVGIVPDNPSELLLSDRLTKLLKKLRDNYDYIIINAPSITTSTDTLFLVKYSDINLFVFKRGFSKKRYIKQLENFIIKYNLKNFGLILNGSIKKEINYV